VSDDIDFFISYNSADVKWAEWIAWVLEKHGGYAVCYQLRDFPPGSNFVSLMQDAAARARHTIAVLSPAYLEATYTESEWAAAFAQDPRGTQRRLIPVMVAECEPGGLLRSIVHVRLMGLDEDDARDALLRGVSATPATGRAGTREDRPPQFPGATRPADEPPSRPPVSVRPRIQETAGPAPEPAQPQLPWTPLTAQITVHWEDQPRPTADQGEIIRLELHLSPLSATQGGKTPALRYAHATLVTVGRQSGVFPSSATVSIQSAHDYVAAVLDAPDGSQPAGLRISSDNERTAWLTLPATRLGDMWPAVPSGLAKLLQALAGGVRFAPSEHVALAAGISSADGQVRLDPRDSLPAGWLTSHAPQIAGELARQLISQSGAGEEKAPSVPDKSDFLKPP
jgi:hypothetical protein